MNKLPPGYIPLTAHSLPDANLNGNGSQGRSSNGGGRSEGRNNYRNNNGGGRGRHANNHRRRGPGRMIAGDNANGNYNSESESFQNDQTNADQSADNEDV
ncbi:hypothetical protein JNK13_07410 [bacterium]|nr:hypothetical protein [bacterium]